MNELITKRIAEEIADNRMVLVVGDIFSDQNVNDSYPSLPALAKRLQLTTGMDKNPTLSFGDVARKFLESMRPAQDLIRFAVEEFSTPSRLLTPLHHQLAKLPIKRIVYLGWDGALEAAYQEQNVQLSLLWEKDQLHFLSDMTTQLVMLLGYVKSPDSMLLGSDDVNLVDIRQPDLYQKVAVWLSQNPALFIGDFDCYRSFMVRLLRSRIHDKYTPVRYMVLPKAEQERAQTWESLGFDVIASQPLEFLDDLDRNVKAILSQRIRFQVSRSLKLSAPYLFLDYYEEEHASIFFGRNNDIERVCHAINNQKVLVLYGDSGVGKTSLLLAGVKPKLSEHQIVIYLRPGRGEPFANLREALIRECGRIPEADKISGDPKEWGQTVFQKYLDRTGKTSVLLVLDQFEELFTNIGDVVKTNFLQALHEWVQGRVPVKVLISIRADHYQYLVDYGETYPEFFTARLRLKNFVQEQAREVITRPMMLFGKSTSPQLVERLVRDLQSEKDIDPSQLAIVCYKIFKATPEQMDVLNEAFYDTMGPIDKILHDYINEALEDLPELERKQAIAILKALATSEGRKATVSLEDILQESALPAEKVLTVLEDLVKTRLVRKREREGNFPFELAHDKVAQQIKNFFTDQEKSRKSILEMLKRELVDHENYQSYIAGEKLNAIESWSGTLDVSQEILALILSSCFRYGMLLSDWPKQVHSEVALKPLLAASADREIDTRIRAIRGIGKVALPSARERLHVMLANKDEVPLVVHVILDILANKLILNDLPVLATVMNCPVDDVRERVVNLIGDSGFPEALDILAKAAGDRSSRVRLAAVNDLGNFDSTLAMEKLVEIFVHTDYEEISDLAETILFGFSKSISSKAAAAEILIRYLEETHSQKKQKVLRLVGNLAEIENCALTLVHIAQTDALLENRIIALDALAKNAPKDVIKDPVMSLAFSDKDASIAQSALKILDQLNEEPSFFLGFLYAREETNSKGLAVSVLAKRGLLSQVPQEYLPFAAFHPDVSVREPIAQALLRESPTSEKVMLIMSMASQETNRRIKESIRVLPSSYQAFIIRNADAVVAEILANERIGMDLLDRYVGNVIGKEKSIQMVAQTLEQAMKEMREQHSPRWIQEALKWLKDKQTEQSINYLIELAFKSSPGSSIENYIEELFSYSLPPWVTDVLLTRLVKEEHVDHQRVLIGCLKAVGVPDQQTEQLHQILRLSELGGREKSLHALLSNGKPFQRQVARAMLEYPNDRLREVAIRAVGTWRTSAAVEILENAYFHEGSYELKEIIIDMLAETNLSDAIHALRNLRSKEIYPQRAQYISQTLDSLSNKPHSG